MFLLFAMFPEESIVLMPQFQHHAIFGTITLLFAPHDTNLHATPYLRYVTVVIRCY
jgi:hypothetical protein